MRTESGRRRRRGAALVSVLAGLAVLAAEPLPAQRPTQRDATLELERPAAPGGARTVQNGPVSLDEAIALARRRFEGRVVRAETRVVEGRQVHMIRILDSNGRVRNVQIDAASGRIRR